VNTPEPRCILTTQEPGAAESIVALLKENGFDASIQAVAEKGLEGVGAMSGFGSETKGIFLPDEDQATQAIAFLREALAPPEPTEPEKEYDIVVVCEECGHQVIFSSKLKGTVQECPKCIAYMDVPDEEDDFDYGEPEEDEGVKG
jgi:hypothetical protein